MRSFRGARLAVPGAVGMSKPNGLLGDILWIVAAAHDFSLLELELVRLRVFRRTAPGTASTGTLQRVRRWE